MTRQSRAERRKGTDVQLTERDENLLLALARFRAARTSDLVRLCFGSVRKDTAAARLRRLFDSGYLQVDSMGLSEENVYSLSPRGRRAAESLGQLAGRIPRGTLKHHLSIVSVWVSLACLQRTDIELVRVRPDWELREAQEPLALGLIPDLLTLVKINGLVRAICVEVDLGSESIPVLRSKLSRYGVLQEPGLILAIYAPEVSTARLKAIQQILRENLLDAGIVWTSLSDVSEHFGPPLTASPYSDGTPDPLTEVPAPAPETSHVRK